LLQIITDRHFFKTFFIKVRIATVEVINSVNSILAIRPSPPQDQVAASYQAAQGGGGGGFG
jgi:hypothetical protein